MSHCSLAAGVISLSDSLKSWARNESLLQVPNSAFSDLSSYHAEFPIYLMCPGLLKTPKKPDSAILDERELDSKKVSPCLMFHRLCGVPGPNYHVIIYKHFPGFFLRQQALFLQKLLYE